MTTTARQIKLLAETLDEQGKADAPIEVIGTRANLRKDFPPEKRGGVLRCKGHELRIVTRAEPEPLDNLDWVGGV